ncbi:hypothetical protein [uncultured Gemmiger sp.]|uniref:hypothetical protein n=1 Tax=uncultured Gemmiger sp. TaxID=1623490 RepID=UPI0025946464|nr:hypothetical protein [uncultured Gemmiger sp.]
MLQNAGKFVRKFDFCLEIEEKVVGWGEREKPLRPASRPPPLEGEAFSRAMPAQKAPLTGELAERSDGLRGFVGHGGKKAIMGWAAVWPPVFHISTNPVYRAILWVCTGFSTVSTWFSTFPQWKDVENLCKMWRKPAEARRGGIFCGSFKDVSYAVHFLGACYNSYKR